MISPVICQYVLVSYMTSAQVVETLCTTNGPFEDYTNPDDQTTPTTHAVISYR